MSEGGLTMDQTNKTETPVIDQTKPPINGQQVWWIEEVPKDDKQTLCIQTGIVTDANRYDCYVTMNPYGRHYVTHGRLENLYYVQQEAEDKLAPYKKKLEKEKSISRAAAIWRIITVVLSIAVVILAFTYIYPYPKALIRDLLVFLAPYIGFITVTFFILYLAIGIFMHIIDAIDRSECELKYKNLPPDFLKRDALKD